MAHRVRAASPAVATPAVRALIREQKTFHIYSAISTGRKDGMQTMDQNLIELAQKHIVTQEEALKYAEHPAQLLAKTGGAPVAAAA